MRVISLTNSFACSSTWVFSPVTVSISALYSTIINSKTFNFPSNSSFSAINLLSQTVSFGGFSSAIDRYFTFSSVRVDNVLSFSSNFDVIVTICCLIKLCCFLATDNSSPSSWNDFSLTDMHLPISSLTRRNSDTRIERDNISLTGAISLLLDIGITLAGVLITIVSLFISNFASRESDLFPYFCSLRLLSISCSFTSCSLFILPTVADGSAAMVEVIETAVVEVETAVVEVETSHVWEALAAVLKLLFSIAAASKQENWSGISVEDISSLPWSSMGASETMDTVSLPSWSKRELLDVVTRNRYSLAFTSNSSICSSFILNLFSRSCSFSSSWCFSDWYARSRPSPCTSSSSLFSSSSSICCKMMRLLTLNWSNSVFRAVLSFSTSLRNSFKAKHSVSTVLEWLIPDAILFQIKLH